jgi:anti-sigma factor (TIGR02949 family)
VNALLTTMRRRLRPNAPANCREVATYLHSYLDGEVDEKTLQRLAAHLEDCRKCGLEAETYRALKQALARRSTAPADALTRLHSFAEQLVAGTAE